MQGVATKEAGADSRSAPGQRETTRRRRSSVPREPKRLTDEQAELAGEHWDRAMRLARIYAAKYPKVDLDWESSAAVGLCDAAYTFDASRTVEFWTLAYHRIRGAIFDAMRAERLKGFGRGRYEGKPTVLSMDGKLPYDRAEVGGREGTPHEIIPDGTLPVGWEEQSVDAVYGMTKRLGYEARETVRLYYCHGLTMLQIAHRLGISESRISQLHKQALEFLRTAIKPEAIAS